MSEPEIAQNKPWLMRMLDENANIAPVSGIVTVGAIAFIIVLWLLNATEGRALLARFIPARPAATQQVAQQSKEAVLASLSAASTGSQVSEADKLRVLKSLAERIDSGEEKILLTDAQKLKVLASLQAAH